MIDASSGKNFVKLVFYDTSTRELRYIQDETFKPYFLIKAPLSIEDEMAIRGLNVKIIPAKKKDLFTEETRKLTLVELDDPSLLPVVTRQFKDKWEYRIPYVLSYIYDHNLIFGAPYLLEGGEVKPVYEVNDTLRLRFQEKFLGMKDTDPLKYEMLEKWFTLCSQPIPRVTPRKLGVSIDVDYERLYLAFLLSRIANLPLSMALTNRHVSTWIRSILHFYLRWKNILIPRSAELRKGETVRNVPGALTFQPKTGTYFNTVVVDFESLYPSVVDSYNLSYETVDCDHEECVKNKVPDTNHHVCVKKRGVYSILTGALKDLRIHWFKPLSKDSSASDGERLLAEAASSLLKLILVSSYGVTVRIPGLAQPALAESITAYGRYALRESWNLAKKNGLQPLYGDTDSLFLDNPTDEDVDRLIETVKNRLHLDLAVDKVYSVCVLPRAMKAYFGIRKDGTPDVKGLTAIKSNSPPFIQKVFRDCAMELVNVNNWTEFEEAKKNIISVVKSAVSDLKSGKIPLKELEYTVKLHFDPNARLTDEEVLHQPYQCAVQYLGLRRKIHKGDTVSFIKVKPFNYGGKNFTVKPTELVKDIRETNIDDYVRNLKTALSQTFKPMSLSFNEEPKKTLIDFI